MSIHPNEPIITANRVIFPTFSLNMKNLLNNRNVRTGGYENTRLVSNTKSKEQYFRFAPKYFYMSGFNYMLNIYFRF